MVDNSYSLYHNATLCTLLQTTESRKVLKDHLTVFNPFTSISDQRQNFSLQYQYNIKHRSDENKVKYQLGDY